MIWGYHHFRKHPIVFSSVQTFLNTTSAPRYLHHQQGRFPHLSSTHLNTTERCLLPHDPSPPKNNGHECYTKPTPLMSRLLNSTHYTWGLNLTDRCGASPRWSDKTSSFTCYRGGIFLVEREKKDHDDDDDDDAAAAADNTYHVAVCYFYPKQNTWL